MDSETSAPPDDYTVTCRARVAKGCLHGEPTFKHFGEPDCPMNEDGTYIEGEGLVCDPCYIKIMPLTPSTRALHHEIGPAIARLRATQ